MCCVPRRQGIHASRRPQAQAGQGHPRQALCRALINLRTEHAKIFQQEEALKAKLKLVAETDGKFRETFPNGDYVSVSPGKPAQTIGEAPVLQVEAWNALRESRQAKLIEDGIVAIEPITKGASYGQMRVKLHTDPEGDD